MVLLSSATEKEAEGSIQSSYTVWIPVDASSLFSPTVKGASDAIILKRGIQGAKKVWFAQTKMLAFASFGVILM